MADPHLHLSWLNREVGLSDRRDGAGRQADADAARVVDCFLRGGNDLVKTAAQGRPCAAGFRVSTRIPGSP
jgi:hypothetical protein